MKLFKLFNKKNDNDDYDSEYLEMSREECMDAFFNDHLVENDKDKDKEVRVRNSNQIIAVWGSPGSGKTTISTKLALELSKEKLNVIVVYEDENCPAIPTLIADPKGKHNNKSLGNVLLNNSEQRIIKENLITLEKNKYLGLLGYRKGENYNSYPEYVKEKVTDLFLQLRHLADYIIIDCSSQLYMNIFTNTALEQADKVLTLATADLKSLSYFNSTLPILANSLFKMDEQLIAISNIRDHQPKETINDLLKGKGYYLEFIEEITQQDAEQRMFEELNDKKSEGFKDILKKLMEEIIYE